MFGSEVAVTREDAKRNKLKQLASGAFKSGGTAVVLDPIVNYTTSMTNVSVHVLRQYLLKRPSACMRSKRMALLRASHL